MAVPMTPDEFVGILRAEGLTVKTVGDFRNWNRNHKGPWGPVHGTMLHHTAGHPEGAVEYCRTGSADLPGPLCHGVITKDGVVHIISAGRSNHAGGGDPNVLQAVKDERYTTTPPAPQRGNSNGIDGNAHFYGFECVNLGDGKDPWPFAQVDAMVRVSAAISRRYGWTEKSAIGHKEWSSDKNDPRGPGDVVSMPVLRGKIKERLAHPASWNPASNLPTTPGATVTRPLRQDLLRGENTELIPNSGPGHIYWTWESLDEAGGHGTNGKTVASNVTYSAVLRVQLTGLAAGEVVEVSSITMDATGNETGAGFPVHVVGRTGGGIVHAAIPFIDTTPDRLGFKVVNKGAQVVTMTAVALTAHYWPNA